jgi:hypothetical protein
MVSLANYTPLVVIAWAVLQPNVVLTVLGLVIGTVDLLMHLAYWWLPYVRGGSAAQISEHQRLFGGTTTFLPPIGDHPVPNAQHVVVGLLMVAMVVSTIAAIGAGL